MKQLRTGIICLNLLVSLLCVAAGEAQQAAKTEAGPVPAPILAGKTVFIANGGGDDGASGDSSYSGGRDRAYSQFYAAIKSWDATKSWIRLPRRTCFSRSGSFFRRMTGPYTVAVRIYRPIPSFDWKSATGGVKHCCGG